MNFSTESLGLLHYIYTSRFILKMLSGSQILSFWPDLLELIDLYPDWHLCQTSDKPGELVQAGRFQTLRRYKPGDFSDN